jgi:hypothetical protein
MKKTSRRVVLLSPAALATASLAQSEPVPEELRKMRAAMDAARAALRKVKLERETEPAFSFKA